MSKAFGSVAICSYPKELAAKLVCSSEVGEVWLALILFCYGHLPVSLIAVQRWTHDGIPHGIDKIGYL